jgi:hypothetical protein
MKFLQESFQVMSPERKLFVTLPVESAKQLVKNNHGNPMDKRNLIIILSCNDHKKVR